MSSQIFPTSSNLINKAVQQNLQKKSQISTSSNTAQSTKDTSISKVEVKNISKKKTTAEKIFNFVSSTVLFSLLFFLPDIISLVKNKNFMHNKSLNNKLNKINSFYHQNETTQITSKFLKNNLIQASINTTIRNGELQEKLLLDKKGNIKKRILIKKINSRGKYIVQHMRVFEGNKINDITELKENPTKYLSKEYIRTDLGNGKHNIQTKKNGNIENTSQIYIDNDGMPIIKFTDASDNKIQTKFLYYNNKLIGTDSEIKNKETSNVKNMCTIPSLNLYGKEYTQQESKPYDNKLLNKMKKFFA